MKIVKSSAVAASAIVLGALTLGGCATKGFVRQQVGVVDTKLQATDGNQGARTLFGGMTGPDWVKIDLPSVLHLKPGPGAQAAMRPGPLIKSAN